jgi:hypothetical protein
MAMDNNPSSKRADVVFFTLRLSYRLSDLIVRMGSFLPFKVLEKCTDVTYRVECGNKGKSQIIHVDRMRKRNPQILEGYT